jgi:hypothetical protein
MAQDAEMSYDERVLHERPVLLLNDMFFWSWMKKHQKK